MWRRQFSSDRIVREERKQLVSRYDMKMKRRTNTMRIEKTFSANHLLELIVCRYFRSWTWAASTFSTTLSTLSSIRTANSPCCCTISAIWLNIPPKSCIVELIWVKASSLLWRYESACGAVVCINAWVSELLVPLQKHPFHQTEHAKHETPLHLSE